MPSAIMIITMDVAGIPRATWEDHKEDSTWEQKLLGLFTGETHTELSFFDIESLSGNINHILNLSWEASRNRNQSAASMSH